MTAILVTRGTGTLGTPTVARLRASGHDVRVLSRKRGTGIAKGDLLTGVGVDEAFDGAHTVVHLATTNGAGHVTAIKTLVASARADGVQHLIVISIVGIEHIPLPYYRAKVEVERIVTESGLPYTILRATQFHQLVDALFTVQRYLPVILAPNLSFQPIDVTDVAGRLVQLVDPSSGAAGRVPDIGGPEPRTAHDLALSWKTANNSRSPIRLLRLPGKIAAAYKEGHNLVHGVPFGRGTFDQYLADRYGANRFGSNRNGAER